MSLCRTSINSKQNPPKPSKKWTILPEQTGQGARQHAVNSLSNTFHRARDLGLATLVEPLSSVQTDFINAVDEAMKAVHRVNHRNLKVHLDRQSTVRGANSRQTSSALPEHR